MAHVTTLCRRRWARRGRGLADFTWGFVLAGISHVLVGMYRFGKWTGGCVLALIRLQCRRGGMRTNPQRTCPSATREQWRDQAPAFAPIAEKPGVQFGDVAGLEDAKREIMLRMVLPLRYPKLAKRFGIRRGGGLLLYGPPGTGKTLLAKAVATEVDASFYHIRPSDIMSAQVGQAEKNVCRLFRILRQEKRAVLFIDEIESLVPSRRRNGSTIMQRVISQFLGEVDGLGSTFDDHILLLIGATNEPDMIDPAMLRPGRFDTKVHVGPPDAAARNQIILRCLGNRAIAPGMLLPQLVELTKGKTGADIRGFVNQAADRAFLRSIARRDSSMSIEMSDFQTTEAPIATASLSFSSVITECGNSS